MSPNGRTHEGVTKAALRAVALSGSLRDSWPKRPRVDKPRAPRSDVVACVLSGGGILFGRLIASRQLRIALSHGTPLLRSR
jgi:hypothetical protein